MDTRYETIYLPPARMDLLDIVRFHKERVGPVSAKAIYQTIQEKITHLGDFPLIGPLHPDPELAMLGYRKLVLTKTYVAIYKILDGRVLVYRIVSGMTNYPKLLK